MIIANEVTSITALVSYLKGSEITNQIIPFKIYKEDHRYKAIPLINNEERKQAGLPAEIYFQFINKTIVPGKETSDKGIEVLKNIVQELKMQKLL